jgi:hypothetical protein
VAQKYPNESFRNTELQHNGKGCQSFISLIRFHGITSNWHRSYRRTHKSRKAAEAELEREREEVCFATDDKFFISPLPLIEISIKFLLRFLRLLLLQAPACQKTLVALWAKVGTTRKMFFECGNLLGPY